MSAKLYFRYGAVSSAKTLNLLAVAHNYKMQGRKVVLMKPAIDDRFGKEIIKSRAGLIATADLVIKTAKDIEDYELGSDTCCILVDEAEFLDTACIDLLRHVVTQYNIPVICYGLRTDFKTHLFEGSKRLMELADSIEEVKTNCTYCNRKAIVNLKFLNGKPTLKGPQIELGTEEKYLPVCYKDYKEKLELEEK